MKWCSSTYDVAVVGLVIRAHDTAGTSTNSISERPDVELVEGDVVDIGRDGVGDVGTSLSEVLLLVEDVVLSASNDTSILDTLDGLGVQNTRKDWVRAEAFPVTSTFGAAAKRTNNGTKHDIDALVAVFAAHIMATLVGKLSVPCGSNSNAGGECGNEVT